MTLFMKSLKIFLALCTSSLMLICPVTEAATSSKLVVSIKPLSLILQELLPQSFEVVSLMTKSQDPHTYEPRPSDMILLEQKNLYLIIDSNLESSLPQKPQPVEVLGFLPSSAAIKLGLFGRDPHFWLSPKSTQALLPALESFLCEKFEHHCDEIRKKSAHFSKRLTRISSELTEKKSAANLTLVVSHNSFSYLCRDLSWTCRSIDGGGSHHHHHGHSAGEIASMIDSLQGQSNIVLVSELSISSTAINTLARKTRFPLVQLDILGHTPNALTYEDLIRSIVTSVIEAHQKQTGNF